MKMSAAHPQVPLNAQKETAGKGKTSCFFATLEDLC